MGLLTLLRGLRVIANPKETKRKMEDTYDKGKAALSKKPRRSWVKSKTKRKAKRMGEDWKRINKP